MTKKKSFWSLLQEKVPRARTVLQKEVKHKMTKSQRKKYVSKVKFVVKANVIRHNECVYFQSENSSWNTIHSFVICYMFRPFSAIIIYISQDTWKSIPSLSPSLHS